MSILDTRLVYITKENFLQLNEGKYGIIYKIKDDINQPEFIWDGLKFVQYLSYDGNNVDFNGLYIKNAIFGDSSNNSTFNNDGALVASGSALRWVDIDFPILERTPIAGRPAQGSFIGDITAPVWQVNDYSSCEGEELIHSWKEGSDVSWHCHVFTGGTDNTDRYLKWELQWAWADLGEVVTNQTITTDDIIIQANTPNLTHIIMPLGVVNIPGHIAGHVFARLKRIASTGQSPSNNPFCTMLQMHIQIDTLGSSKVYQK